MVKKLKFKKFQINFSNKLFYTLVAIGIFIAIGIGVYAYGGSQPNVVGHSAGELDLSEGVNGNAIFNGNVGIGTTNPGNKLTISTAGADDTIPALGANGGKLGIFRDASYGLIAGQIVNGNAFVQVQRIDGTATAYNLLLQPKGGNVGIGTTTPHGKLDVAGNIKATKFIGASDTIFCSKRGYKRGGRGSYTFSFTAAECGGTLPNSNYIGTGVQLYICNGLLTWSVNQAPSPGVTIASTQGGPCGHYIFQVLYIRTR